MAAVTETSARYSNFSFQEREPTVDTFFGDLSSDESDMCLTFLKLQDLGRVACVSRSFQKQAFLCEAQPPDSISYRMIIEAHRALKQDDDRPFLKRLMLMKYIGRDVGYTVTRRIIRKNGLGIEFVPLQAYNSINYSDVTNLTENIALLAVKQNGLAFPLVGKIRDQVLMQMIIDAAIRQNAAVWSLFSEQQQNNERFMWHCIYVNRKVADFVDELFKDEWFYWRLGRLRN